MMQNEVLITGKMDAKSYCSNRTISDSETPTENWFVSSSLPVNYSVEIVHGLFELGNTKLYELCSSESSQDIRVMVFIDKNVERYYDDLIKKYFEHNGIKCILIPIDGDENTKNINTVLTVARYISDHGLLRRSEKIIAIGGGVVTDVVGFTANLYRRGVPYIRIPTTLMGQIDAGIGIKTGINYIEHKNRLGTYYAPLATLIDPVFLKTISQRHITNGVSEIIKMALIKDERLFEVLEQIVDKLTPEGFASYSPLHKEAISRAIGTMLEV